MGDRFRKGQIENQRRGRDRAAREASERRLFARPDVTRTVYHIQPDEGQTLVVGETVRILLQDVDGPVIAARGNERVGVIEGDGEVGLKPALADTQGPGIADVRIIGIEAITHEALAEMIVPAAQ